MLILATATAEWTVLSARVERELGKVWPLLPEQAQTTLDLCHPCLHPSLHTQWLRPLVVTGSSLRQGSLRPVARDISLYPKKGCFCWRSSH